MDEVRRDLWASSYPTLLLKQNHLEQFAQDLFQMPLHISKDAVSTTSLGNLLKCSVMLTVKVFLKVQRESPVLQLVPVASYPITGLKRI